MKWTRRLVRRAMERLYPGTKQAREAMEKSRAGTQDVDRLVADLRRLHANNHFSQALARTLGGH